LLIHIYLTSYKLNLYKIDNNLYWLYLQLNQSKVLIIHKLFNIFYIFLIKVLYMLLFVYLVDFKLRFFHIYWVLTKIDLLFIVILQGLDLLHEFLGLYFLIVIILRNLVAILFIRIDDIICSKFVIKIIHFLTS
jgi:hypothetical protein